MRFKGLYGSSMDDTVHSVQMDDVVHNDNTDIKNITQNDGSFYEWIIAVGWNSLILQILVLVPKFD